MIAICPQALRPEAGFTLIEMLVVLALLVLVAGVAMPLLSGGSDGLRLQIASSELAAAFRATRSAAILRHTETTLLIDVERRTFQSTVMAPRAFAAGIDARLTFAAGVGATPSDGGFRFFSDGSSTGGDVLLSLHGQQARLCIDWLTGQVLRDGAC